jgi:hypothetical protein
MSLLRALYVILRNNEKKLFYSMILLIIIVNITSILINKSNYIERFDDKSIGSKLRGSKSIKLGKLNDKPIIFIGGYQRSGTTLMR